MGDPVAQPGRAEQLHRPCRRSLQHRLLAAPLLVFLNDHKAETLDRAVAAVQAFAAENDKDDLQFQLAAGNAGIEAATNEVIKQSELIILVLVYICVAAMCMITFRSFAATLCIVLPLILTSVLGNALMAALGIGVKVATLPVIALGVGIGVDYGIYIYTRLESFLRMGLPRRPTTRPSAPPARRCCSPACAWRSAWPPGSRRSSSRPTWA